MQDRGGRKGNGIMKELVQARDFYHSLNQREKEELRQMLAEDIFFLEEDLQQKILTLLQEVEPELKDEISRRNTFTTN